MKDDFYKDMNHKRAQDEKASKKTAGNKKTDQPKHETLSRSARHKAKDNAADKQPVKNKDIFLRIMLRKVKPFLLVSSAPTSKELKMS